MPRIIGISKNKTRDIIRLLAVFPFYSYTYLQMSPSLFILFFLSFDIILALPNEINLKTAFQSALEKNETTAIAKSETQASGEKVTQAFGKVLPQMSLIGSYIRQDDTGLIGTTKPDQTSAKLNVTQALFHGLSDIYAYQAARARERAQKILEFDNKLTLYTHVAESYYQVLSARHDLENLNTLLDLSQKRMSDIRQRVKIGRSRKGELLSAESQVFLIETQVENAKLNLGNSHQKFLLLTGMNPDTPFEDDPIQQNALSASIELYLTLVEKRPDIQAQKELYEASEDMVGAYKGFHWPSLDASGNYYLHREGSLSNSKWDIGVTLTLPLFSGLSTQASINESVENRKVEELKLAYLRRKANNEIKTLFQTFKSSVAQYQTLQRAVKTAEENNKVQQQDYRYGLVTNLDVLQSMNTLLETKRSYEKAHYDAKLSFVKLQGAVGQLPEGL